MIPTATHATPPAAPTHSPVQAPRRIVHRTRGHGGGFITRLMSPSDLGEVLKPFVFLDLFRADEDTQRAMEARGGMPIHPHSGVATVTVITEGRMRFDDPDAGKGTIGYGGVEWMRAGGGVWHGKEMTTDDVPLIEGFQLWLALPDALENGPSESRYIEAADMPQDGPARVIVGEYNGVRSPVPAPDGINYLLVTLAAGETFTYQPPAGHTVGWLAVSQGKLSTGATQPSAVAGDMVVFDNSGATLHLQASGDTPAVFVLGSAVPHPHPLHLGNYSVHTSAKALEIGENRIKELGRTLKALGDRRTASGTVPVLR